MSVVYRLLGLSLFVFVFVCDLLYEIDSNWYLMLMGMMALLFGASPTKMVMAYFAHKTQSVSVAKRDSQSP